MAGTYVYRVRDRTGRLVEGTLEAISFTTRRVWPRARRSAPDLSSIRILVSLRFACAGCILPPGASNGKFSGHA